MFRLVEGSRNDTISVTGLDSFSWGIT